MMGAGYLSTGQELSLTKQLSTVFIILAVVIFKNTYKFFDMFSSFKKWHLIPFLSGVGQI